MKHPMKDRIIGIFLGILIGTMFMTSAAAVSQTVQKTLLYNNLKITLDGVEVIPKDANGVYVEPFAIDGTTYLPVRAISNALGLGVDWDQKTSTVILTSPKEETDPASPTGLVLYDANGVKITYNGIETDMFGDINIKLLIENNTSSAILVQSRDTSVNGFMIDGFLSSEITAGKKANASLSLWKTYLDENEIESIEDLETVFIVMDNDTWDTLFYTDTIMIHPAN